MRDVIVVGGGCYGSFYAAQLARAKQRGRARFRRVVVVDREPACRARRELGAASDRSFAVRDWAAYFREFFDAAAPVASGEPQEYIVPSPLMPHLMFGWLLARARERWPERPVDVASVPDSLGTPYDRTAPAPDHTRYVSFADWICPTHCVEPAMCPAIGGARSWEMGDAVRALAGRLRAAGQPVHGPALFVCRHHVFGVGTFAVEAVLAGDAIVRAAGESGAAAAVLVGTISSCHGAVNLLSLGPWNAGQGGAGR
jgi:glycine/D-amino acid oxidase-like deaminating enzyme